MIQANMHQAKSQLSKLIERAEAGEDVVIARAGKPIVRLVPVEQPSPAPSIDRRNLLGCMAGEIWYADDWEDNSDIIAALEDGDDVPLHPEVDAC